MNKRLLVLACRLLLLCTLVATLAAAPRHASAAGVPAPANPCATQSGSFKLLIDRPGIYVVTQAGLQAAGWNGVPDIARLHLYHGACGPTSEVALDRAATAFRFYGVPSTSRYSTTSVYWLRQESTPGQSMTTRSVAAGSAALQSTRAASAPGLTAGPPLYDTNYPGDDGDHFFQADLRGGATLPITFTLANSVAGAVALHLNLQGISAGLHHLQLTLDSTPLGEQTWSGTTTFSALVALGTGPLANGAHVLRISIPAGAIDAVQLDSATLSYQAQLVASATQLIFNGTAGAWRYSVGGFSAATALLYDVRDPLQPVRLTNATVGSSVVWQDDPAQPARYALLAPGQPLAPTLVADTSSHLAQGGADYVILGYRPFLAALAPLAAYYRSKGMRVATVDVQDTYDEFNGGELHPEALRSFLRYANASWARPAPTYVLLVGDGTYDFRDRLGLGWASFVPPYLANVDPWMGEAACETCYARVQTDDPRDESLPDLFVGRMPVRSADEASVVVAKTLGYLSAAPRGGWQATSLFLTDNTFDANGQPDPAGDFAAVTENAISALPPGNVARRFFYDPSPGGATKPAHYADPAVLRDAFFRAFDEGAVLVSYVGHANYWQWAYTEPNTQPSYLWYLYDADARSNGDRLPVLLALTCLTGFFQEPVLPTTDERLLTHVGGGIVASFSSAGLGVDHGHALFSHAVIRALYSANPADRSLGAAQLAGFRAVLAGGCCADLPFTYEILGDPALRLSFVPTATSYLPLVQR